MKIYLIIVIKVMALFTSILSFSQITYAAKAQVNSVDEPLIIANKFSFQSSLLEEKRNFYIHLPAGYPKQNQTYPVLYITDAKRKMQKTSAIVDDLAEFGRRIPEMIVVGIETNNNRTADLSTFNSSIAFLNFITKELQPFINKNYQTNGENLLMGSSMGGEFVLRALFSQPNAFDAFFAISPSVYYSNFQLVDQAAQLSINKSNIKKSLFISVANEGWNQGVEQLVYQLKKQPIKGLKWQFNKLEEESHGSISFKRAYDDLQSYYKDWAAPHFNNTVNFEIKGGIELLQSHYNIQRQTLIPIGLLNHLALLYVDENKPEKAIELSLLAVEAHQTSGRALRNLAIVYEKFNMLEQALTTYEKAITISIGNNHRPSSIASHKQVLAEFKAKHLLN